MKTPDDLPVTVLRLGRKGRLAASWGPHLLLHWHCDKWDRLREALLEPWTRIDKAQELLKDNESDVDTLDGADSVTLLLGGREAGGLDRLWQSASGSDTVTTTSSAADSTST